MLIRSTRSRYILVAMASFLLGAGVIYFYMKSILNRNNEYIVRIIDNCSASMATSQRLIDNCGQAYNVATSCASHLNTCDVASETKKLEALNEERIAAETKLTNLTKDLSNIIPEAHNK